LFTLLDLCVSSLRRGHANLLCIVPILTDDPRRESEKMMRIQAVPQRTIEQKAVVLFNSRSREKNIWLLCWVKGYFVVGLYSSVAERQSCKLKVLGSIPSGGSFLIHF
jgi:hypothetical protein